MLRLLIQKYKKISKTAFWLVTISTVSPVLILVACSQNLEPEKPKDKPTKPVEKPVEKMPSNPFEKWGKNWDSFLEKNPSAAIYEKVTNDKKPFIQLNTFGFKYFTFSDWYWGWYYGGNEKSLEGSYIEIRKDDSDKDNELIDWKTGQETPKMEPFITGGFIKKPSWIYENGNKNIWYKKGDEKYKLYVEKSEIEKKFDTNHKSISLIKNEDDLKTALRFDNDSWKIYYEYFKSIDNEWINVTGQKYKEVCYYGSGCEPIKDLTSRFLPWSKTFNYPLIKYKMNLNKYNYLFLKDFWNLWIPHVEADIFLEGGITIENYDIDVENKNITLDFREISGLLPMQFVQNMEWRARSDRLTSFMIPVEKNKLNDFDFNDWTITYK
ncbi:hypothetical protein CJJ23_04640 [Mycoplasmopsis agassizii]|uniref:Lipoprotein n=1 Tax=Mycoplasmopsis agassizii TaxID=33922 RepID=A0A269TJM0_9BACT|nr:hypothetical protein [Mycoplasmopsis agassizii]PAK20915.1 hypothetical protein CJJ23_04640 [Mycoplasmopsis agassizii]